MNQDSASLTLGKYWHQMKEQALQSPFLTYHTCRFCAGVVIDFPEFSKNVRWIDASVRGLTEDIIFEGAYSGCLLFSKWLEHLDWDHCSKGTGWEIYFTIVPNDYNKDFRSTSDQWTDQDGFRIKVKAHDAKHVVFQDLSPWYTLSSDEGGQGPPWLSRSKIWNTSAASDESIAKAISWFEECHHAKAHAHCSQVPRDFVPTRLIHIPDGEASSQVEIIATSHAKYIPWMALSYCWGGPQSAKTTTTNFKNGSRAIGLSALPKTILDAVIVARKLGIFHLWVDSLCILQDDAEDLERELGSMPKIYSNAVVTLIASTATHADEGFLQPRSFRNVWDTSPVRLRGTDASGKDVSVVLHHLTSEVTVDPIDVRAWTLQERLLAPRALVLGRASVSWICKSNMYSESALQPEEHVAMSLMLKGTNSHGPNEHRAVPYDDSWPYVIQQYCNRKLSYASDKLIAIAAIAETFGTTKQWHYLAGLWREDIQSSAIWFYAFHTGNKRPNSYLAPSWSWASVDSDHRLYAIKTSCRAIESAITAPEAPTLPYGNAKSGSMIVKGRCTKVFLRRNLNAKESLHLVIGDDVLHSQIDPQSRAPYSVYLDAPEDDLDGWDKYRGWEVFLVVLNERPCLSYEYVGFVAKTIEGAPASFQRMGAFFIESGWLMEHMKTAAITRVTVV